MAIPGEYVQSLMKHTCFIPDALPPAGLTLSADALSAVESATMALGRVDAIARLIPNPELLSYTSLKIEAIASSTIENTMATSEELMIYQFTEQSDREQVKEVANYGRALEVGLSELRRSGITVEGIHRMHKTLLTKVRGSTHGGVFKSNQNFIGARGGSIASAEFVPPPPERVPKLMADLMRYMTAGAQELKVVQVAFSHYQFETIHPYADGNGRIGRLLIVLQLMHLGLLSDPILYPSAYFERTRGSYYAALQRVRRVGDWDGWIRYFAQGIAEQCDETMNLVSTIQQTRDVLRAMVADVRRQASLGRILDEFFVEPVGTAAGLSERTGLSYKTVTTGLDALQALGIVEVLLERPRSRVYVCGPLKRVLFD